jgi:D-lyxose ketol-isomerase
LENLENEPIKIHLIFFFVNNGPRFVKAKKKQLFRRYHEYMLFYKDYYVVPDKFYIEDINQIFNRFNNNLKCTLIKHKTNVFEEARRNS